MSKPTVLHTEGTAQISQWFNTKFLILPRKYMKVEVIVESLWWWQPNCKQALKDEVHSYKKRKGRRGKGKKTHTDSKIGFLWFSKSETIETNWSRDSPRLKSINLRRGCRLQHQGWSESRQHVVVHHHSGRQAWLAWAAVQELQKSVNEKVEQKRRQGGARV